MKIKNPAYQVVSGVTYSVSYILSILGRSEDIGNIAINPYIFAAVTIGFCIIYVPLALVLVYRFAPKTFRIR